jgi:hypothetical protein
MGLLKPKLAVQKCGRTTGIRKGTVNGFFLQSWDGGVVTTEIAILGKTNFADKGDSGSCVITDEDFPQAVGMVIGKNRLNHFVFVTPLGSILHAAGGGYEWGS